MICRYSCEMMMGREFLSGKISVNGQKDVYLTNRVEVTEDAV